MEHYNRQTDRVIRKMVDDRCGGEEAQEPTAPEEGDEMPDDDISNNLGDTYNEHHHYHRGRLSSLASGLLGAGVGGVGIAALLALLGVGNSDPAPQTPTQQTQTQEPGVGKAFVELFYKRSDGTLVPLDGAETDQGADISIKVE